MTRIVFLLVAGLHLLDLAGPAQAFRTAADLGCGYELHYVAEQEDVRTAQGVTVRAEKNWPSLTADDLIIVPGWRSPMNAGAAALSATVLGRLTGHHADGGTVVSICAGADALGRAGLLEGRRCTTHHLIQDELAARYPGATVIRDVLYVVDGRIATSAGIASGIDLALYLIAVRDGPVIAARVAREMVIYARRNGDEQQASAMLRHRNHLSDLAHRAQDSIEARFADPLPLADLAAACGGQRAHAHPPLRRRDGHDAAAVPAGAPGRARRAPDRAWGDGRGSRAHGRLRRRPHAPPPAPPCGQQPTIGAPEQRGSDAGGSDAGGCAASCCYQRKLVSAESSAAHDRSKFQR